jgi:hypothetical protein
VVLVSLREEAGQCSRQRCWRSLEFSILRPSESTGTAREIIRASEAKLEEYAARKEALAAEIAAESSKGAKECGSVRIPWPR